VIEAEETAAFSIKNATITSVDGMDLWSWGGDVRVKKSNLIAGGDLELGTYQETAVFRVDRNILLAGGILRLAQEDGLLVARDNEGSGELIIISVDSGDIEVLDNDFVATTTLSVGTAGWSGQVNIVSNSLTVESGDLWVGAFGEGLLMDNDVSVVGDVTVRGWNQTRIIDNDFSFTGNALITAEGPAGVCVTSGNTGDPVACQ